MTRKIAIPAMLAAAILAIAGGAAVTAQPHENEKFDPQRLGEVRMMLDQSTPH